MHPTIRGQFLGCVTLQDTYQVIQLCIFWKYLRNYFPHFLIFLLYFVCCYRIPDAPRCFSVHKLRGVKNSFFRIKKVFPGLRGRRHAVSCSQNLSAMQWALLSQVLQYEGANMFETFDCHHLQVGIRLLDLCRPLCRWSPQLHLSCHGGGAS